MKNGEKSTSRIRAKYQKPCFLQNMVVWLYMMKIRKKRFIIDHEILESNKTDEWNLIGIPKKKDVIFSDHDYFCIHDDLFDRIKSTHQDRKFLWRFYIMNQTKMNLRVKQQRQKITRSKIRRGVLPNIQ